MVNGVSKGKHVDVTQKYIILWEGYRFMWRTTVLKALLIHSTLIQRTLLFPLSPHWIWDALHM